MSAGPGVPTSIATVCISGTLEEKLTAVAAAGFDGVEIFEPDLVACPLAPPAIAERCAALGLSIDLYQPFRDLDSADPEQFTRNLRRAERKFEVMTELGCDLMLVCSSPLATAVTDDALLAEQLHTAAESAHRHGIRLAYEALAWGRHVNTYRHSWDIVRTADHPALGLCLDSFHILSRGDDPTGIRDIPGEKIFFVQWSDASAESMDVLQWSRHHRNFPGQGSFDLTRFGTELRASGYRGPWSLEIFNDTFRGSDTARTAVDALRSLRFLQDAVAAREQAGGVDVPGSGGVDVPGSGGVDVPGSGGGAPGLFRVPAASPLEGIVSLRIAAGPGKGAALQSMLDALGFRLAGRHREHDLQLWRHGRLTIVLDATPGTAWTAPGLPAHLPVLTQIGVRSADPESWTDRAAALGVSAGTVGLPGAGAGADVARMEVTPTMAVDVRAPDAAALWGEAFEAYPAHRAEDLTPLFTAVDHVGLAVADDDWDGLLLVLRSLFAMAAHDEPDTTDAVGLMRNRSLTAPIGDAGAGLRITMGMVSGVGASRFGTARRGGISHVALACEDVFTTAAAMRARGFEPLAVPPNYYDDLEARFALPRPLLERMSAAGILYDRDDAGEMFHLFTPTVGADFFFEVVQRVGGYRGFGDANAAVRLAAQLRADAAAAAAAQP